MSVTHYALTRDAAYVSVEAETDEAPDMRTHVVLYTDRGTTRVARDGDITLATEPLDAGIEVAVPGTLMTVTAWEKEKHHNVEDLKEMIRGLFEGAPRADRERLAKWMSNVETRDLLAGFVHEYVATFKAR